MYLFIKFEQILFCLSMLIINDLTKVLAHAKGDMSVVLKEALKTFWNCSDNTLLYRFEDPLLYIIC